MTFLPIGDAELYTETSGSGEPVLLLHGGFCSLETMRPQADALATTHTVVAYERPGHGRTADIDGPYDYARGVSDAAAVLDRLGIASAHFVGYSDGAIIALMLALEQPERVRSIVAISANLHPSGFTSAITEIAQAGVPVGAESTHATADATTAEVSAPELDEEEEWYARLSPDGPEHAPMVIEKLRRLWTNEPDIDPASLATIAVPSLIVAGEFDAIRPEHTALIASSIPRGRLHIVAGASHGVVSEQPEHITALLQEFLAEAE
ncbi:pimeloyl-ACP methyl ester carboxylesterase [Homoserinimonas aerilata]|uniref:Pimeloyl-ACP methyl ester carboxylesterase n=1 Tax=Homoserinimonas aerilata TaxID=1162970 RepID=A0A542YEV6_9MICO|nr:alpha/beta hydrolase [Homoserinimonas aerilata]TQL46619.1 pimeloyl-ACP methyl ester carboxylesterase [Homoserinimonas aerilata]